MGFLLGLFAPWMKLIILDRENFDEYLWKCSMSRKVMQPAEAINDSYKPESHNTLSDEGKMIYISYELLNNMTP